MSSFKLEPYLLRSHTRNPGSHSASPPIISHVKTKLLPLTLPFPTPLLALTSPDLEYFSQSSPEGVNLAVMYRDHPRWCPGELNIVHAADPQGGYQCRLTVSNGEQVVLETEVKSDRPWDFGGCREVLNSYNDFEDLEQSPFFEETFELISNQWGFVVKAKGKSLFSPYYSSWPYNEQWQWKVIDLACCEPDDPRLCFSTMMFNYYVRKSLTETNKMEGENTTLNNERIFSSLTTECFSNILQRLASLLDTLFNDISNTYTELSSHLPEVEIAKNYVSRRYLNFCIRCIKLANEQLIEPQMKRWDVKLPEWQKEIGQSAQNKVKAYQRFKEFATSLKKVAELDCTAETSMNQFVQNLIKVRIESDYGNLSDGDLIDKVEKQISSMNAVKLVFEQDLLIKFATDNCIAELAESSFQNLLLIQNEDDDHPVYFLRRKIKNTFETLVKRAFRYELRNYKLGYKQWLPQLQGAVLKPNPDAVLNRKATSSCLVEHRATGQLCWKRPEDSEWHTASLKHLRCYPVFSGSETIAVITTCTCWNMNPNETWDEKPSCIAFDLCRQKLAHVERNKNYHCIVATASKNKVFTFSKVESIAEEHTWSLREYSLVEDIAGNLEAKLDGQRSIGELFPTTVPVPNEPGEGDQDQPPRPEVENPRIFATPQMTNAGIWSVGNFLFLSILNYSPSFNNCCQWLFALSSYRSQPATKEGFGLVPLHMREDIDPSMNISDCTELYARVTAFSCKGRAFLVQTFKSKLTFRLLSYSSKQGFSLLQGYDSPKSASVFKEVIAYSEKNPTRDVGGVKCNWIASKGLLSFTVFFEDSAVVMSGGDRAYRVYCRLKA